ncbi:MAG: hypothetical protein A2341_14350 [Deltaproteobacteria bacterium RIFOXYB12_FULL_58_9]|nr:MAG: hypothetical protein A2341_14350 [Deltaproteobacteria bacterium RIFOXYB12_FULL_58_9]
MNKHLKGIRVVDLTAYLSGPFATVNLAALGAEVIKIERPKVGDPCRWNPPFAGPGGVAYASKNADDLSLLYLKRNRGKKSVFLDLGSDKGKDILLRLVEKSDIVIENFTPGVMDRLGLNYERLKEANPRIIFCSISGYGQHGPHKDRSAFDLTVQATSGIMGLTGLPDGPPVRCGAWIGDMIPSLYGVIGILAALVAREKTGEGERIDISMQDACFSVATDEAMDLNIKLGHPTRTGNRLFRLSPWDSYAAKDGYVAICVANNPQWNACLEAIGREDLKDDPRYSEQQGRFKNAEEVEQLLRDWVTTRTKEEVVTQLRTKKVPCDIVPTFDEVLEDEQLNHRGMVQDVVHPRSGSTGLKAAGFPIWFSEEKPDKLRPAPFPGEHSKDVLRELLGLTDQELEALETEKVI